MLFSRRTNYISLTRFDRPVGIYLLLCPTLWSLWLAGDGQPQRIVLVVFILGVILMRSAGCVLNDCADRKLDAEVERTRTRPLPAGNVSLTEALILASVLLLLAFALVLMLNLPAILMSLPALALAASYPFMKRFFPLPQAYLGLAFGWAIPMAWVAQTATFPPVAIWLLYLANICWAIAYDTMYALADREDDLRIGIKSSAILFGRYDRIFIALFQAGTLGLLIVVGTHYALGIWFYLSVLIASLLAGYQQWLIRTREPQQCIRAFTNNIWFGFVIFGGIALSLLP